MIKIETEKRLEYNYKMWKSFNYNMRVIKFAVVQLQAQKNNLRNG